MKTILSGSRLVQLIFGGVMSCSAIQVSAQVSYQHIIVHRVGDGTSTLTSRSSAVYLDEYSTQTAGQSVPTTTIALPYSANSARLTESGTSSSNARLSLSPDGSHLLVTGYDADSGTLSITSSSAPRAIDTVGALGIAGRVDTATSVFSANWRSATTDGSNNYWGGGNATGVYYFGNTANPTALVPTTYNVRCVKVFNGGLYYSSAASTAGYGISEVGAGLPTTTGQTTTPIITAGTSTSTSSPYDFAFNSTITICYIADDRATSGVQKWVKNGSTWALAYTLDSGATGGVYSLAVDFTGTYPNIYAVQTTSAGNGIIKITDSAAANSPVITLATAAPGTFLRGIAFSPLAHSSGVPQVTQNHEIMIYPNPAKNMIMIKADGKIRLINIYNITGQKVLSFPNIDQTTISLALKGLTPGNYILNAETENGSSINKIQVTE